MKKISAVYKIINAITGDFYIGSSKDVKQRWATHKCPSVWNRCPNNPMYLDMQKYGVDKFEFEILTEVEADKLKEKEQQFIETLNPTYNQINAKGWDFERYKESRKEYEKSDKFKEYQKEYRKSDKGKESIRKAQNKYNKSAKGKEYQKEYQKEYKKEYNNQLCCYNGETLTLNALSQRFRRQGIDNPTTEAKKYIKNNNPIEFYDIYP